MCGIVGIVAAPADDATLRALVEAMNATLVHRGPDEGGVETLGSEGAALGMRRLSILDHAGGHQPMWDEERRLCVVFNGEIYNFAPLREELVARGHRFASDHSDTEVLVHGFEEWGTALFARLNGMFAVAIWDRRARTLTIARDRIGEKPLYLARLDRGWAFASELKALLQHPGVSRDLDLLGVEQYFAFDYTVGARTVLEGITRLPPASFAVLTADGMETTRYWTPSFAVDESLDEETALARLDELLDRSVRMRMVADVPLGLFLSGGLDSSTIGYYMRRHSDHVQSFSIGFEEAGYDESPYARAVAERLGIDHHLEVLSQERAAEIVPRLPEILDEPMADASILPTYLLSQFARRSVTVALGGDGSDELLMGYSAYQGLRVAAGVARAPRPLGAAAMMLARQAPRRLGPLRLRGLGWVVGAGDSVPGRVLTQLPFLDGYVGSADTVLAPELRDRLSRRPVEEAEAFVLDGVPPDTGWVARATAAYLRGYLPDDILVKVDRASMAASLEVRAPFLDAELVDFLLALPPRLKLRRLTPKHLLKTLMAPRLPTDVVSRPKAGFNIPMSEWLRTTLRPLVTDYLSHDRIQAGGVFDADVVAQLLREHLSGERDRGDILWRLLQLETWRERWVVQAQPAVSAR